ncbi:MAG: fructose-bisphosphate aldolase [Candidatus Synoicihabitans palmerolidicus]|nr:fructose-bisphosphate aldolase [Candidatus Synoicihabitans palmerolidicus]
MWLKTGMIMPGEDCAQRATDPEIAEATLNTFRHVVPATVPGIVRLSGGQEDVDATERLNNICRRGDTPWTISFSFGRALHAALRVWAGDPASVIPAQTELQGRARLNSLAVQGLYPTGSERVFA